MTERGARGGPYSGNTLLVVYRAFLAAFRVFQLPNAQQDNPPRLFEVRESFERKLGKNEKKRIYFELS